MNFDFRNEAYMAFIDLVENDFNVVSLKQKDKYITHQRLVKKNKTMRDNELGDFFQKS